MSNNENSKLKKKNKMLQENLTEFQNVTIILYREAVTLFQIELLINYCHLAITEAPKSYKLKSPLSLSLSLHLYTQVSIKQKKNVIGIENY